MTESSQSANLDARPAAFLEAYDTIVILVKFGCDLIFTLSLAIPQAQWNPDLRLQVELSRH